MFNIRAKVVEVLKQIGLPYGFVSKDEGPPQFLVYNVSSKPTKFEDDEEATTNYKVTINIFSLYDYTEIEEKVHKLMHEAGFVKESYPTCIYIENMGMYNQPMYFNYFVEEKN